MAHDVCIIGLKCYDLLTGASTPRYLGGIEKVLVSLARGFRDAGQRVAFITLDETGGEDQVVDGITILPAYTPGRGLPGTRFLHPKATGLIRAMRRADARYYLQMGAGMETMVAAIATRFVLHGRTFVYLLGSDSDSNASLPLIDPAIEKPMFRWGLRNADSVIAQTRQQQDALLANFGVPSTVIPMPFTSSVPPQQRLIRAHCDVLWVGRFVPEKRLEWLLSLASATPAATFHIVGAANAESAYQQSLIAEANTIKNIRLHGRVSEAELEALYRDSHVLCCTSVIEGFPTTFLEAWSSGMPVLTTFDPDGVVGDANVGLVCNDEAELQQALARIIADDTTYQALSRRAERFFSETFRTDIIVRQHLDNLLAVEQERPA